MGGMAPGKSTHHPPLSDKPDPYITRIVQKSMDIRNCLQSSSDASTSSTSSNSLAVLRGGLSMPLKRERDKLPNARACNSTRLFTESGAAAALVVDVVGHTCPRGVPSLRSCHIAERVGPPPGHSGQCTMPHQMEIENGNRHARMNRGVPPPLWSCTCASPSSRRRHYRLSCAFAFRGPSTLCALGPWNYNPSVCMYPTLPGTAIPVCCVTQ